MTDLELEIAMDRIAHELYKSNGLSSEATEERLIAEARRVAQEVRKGDHEFDAVWALNG